MAPEYFLLPFIPVHMEAGIVFSLSKPAAACRENLTCFVDYVQTLSCLLRNDLGASSYNITATWVDEDDPENTVAACSLLELSRSTNHTEYICTVDMTELLADIKVQVDVTEIADRQHVISRSFYMRENKGYNISWETIYQNPLFYFLNEELEYQLRYKRGADTWETQKIKSVHEDKRTLVILPWELQGNTEYEFQVRARPREDTGYYGFWSEWSSRLTLKTSPAAVTQRAGMEWMLFFIVAMVITASITTFLAKQQSLWKKIACIPDPSAFFKPLYLMYNGDFKKWVGTSHMKMTIDLFEWEIVPSEVLEVFSMRPSNCTSQEEIKELKNDLPCKPCVSCLTAPVQDSLLSGVNSSSVTQDRSYGHLSIDTVTVADEFTPCNCQCNCNRMYREQKHNSDEDSAGENGYPKVNIDDEDRRPSSALHLSDVSSQDKILASGSMSTGHLRTAGAPGHQKVEEAVEGGMGSILEALCLHPNPWDLENPASLPSPDGESVSYSEGSCDFFPRSARPGDSYPMICLDLDTIDSGFVDSDCGSPVDCDFEQNSQTNCGSVSLEQEGEDFPRSYVKQWISCHADSPASGTQTN
ncbi:interleukin-21 receptor isoform X3 [Tympanuchus pallidicinctus]|uniref:interleukin-21 receptor isoform X3 n=1 Tax=Tympanuchus pallidicinctus TaxID=109042 RepID=UPI002286E394|nr:interleukin-21 receptor isoform X3 [Tympanuchus pallidicinctus]